MRASVACIAVGLTALCGARAEAQTRLAILQAEERRAATPQDVALLKAGVRSKEPEIRRVAVRAVGRLERPLLIRDLLPALKAPFPEIRAEAATAIGQAAQGWKLPAQATATPALDDVARDVIAALRSERDPGVRAALCETIGRLPYTRAEQVARAESALIETLPLSQSFIDRIGAAKGMGTLVRAHQKLRAPSREALAALRALAAADTTADASGARVRRLALQALVAAKQADAELVTRTARDPDVQVRRLAMRAGAGGSGSEDPLIAGVADRAPMVRIEALRALRARGSDRVCAASIAALEDREMAVVLVALDQLAVCGSSAAAVALLSHAVEDVFDATSPRNWHRAAHALVSLATASPGRAATALPQFVGSEIWQLRLYAARTATAMHDQPTLEILARDQTDNVREAAIEGLTALVGHAADAAYIAQLSRPGYQVLRAAALALDGTPMREAAVAPLSAAFARLFAEGRDNSRDARDAIAATLAGLGAAPPVPRKRAPEAAVSDLNPDGLRRLAAARARIIVRGVGTMDVALITSDAPATVLRFARLAESGYYNGLTFHRVEPNFVVQGGSPGANEYVGDARFMRDEVGQWPHVRGTVGLSTRGRDTGDAQLFIDVVDNPALDHEYTVFGQVLSGTDLIEQILEGDVIESIQIIPK